MMDRSPATGPRLSLDGGGPLTAEHAAAVSMGPTQSVRNKQTHARAVVAVAS